MSKILVLFRNGNAQRPQPYLLLFLQGFLDGDICIWTVPSYSATLTTLTDNSAVTSYLHLHLHGKLWHLQGSRMQIVTQPSNRILTAVHIKKKLEMPQWTALTSLCSEYCVDIPDYQALIGRLEVDNCPECRILSLNVDHLFVCAAHPTSLTPDDLWASPRKVVAFLSTWPCVSHLPPLPPREPPSPRPPPQPPLSL